MKVEGRLLAPKKGEKYLSVDLGIIAVFTQGRTRKDAYAMAKDAIELLDDSGKLRVEIEPGEGDRFYVTSKDATRFLAFILERIRVARGLTVREVAKRLHAKSPNAYARYEQGATIPSVEKLDELLTAVDKGLGLVLKAG